MKKTTKIMALTTLILSTMMIISSENWLSMWMGLEINMMSFIPLIEKQKNIHSSQAKMTYFLIQSMSSILFLFIILMNPMTITSKMFMSEISMTIITASMLMKMGMAPMHMWFIEIMKKMSWNNCMMLMTWQKLGPLFITSNLENNKMIILISTIASALIGAIGGINQTSLHKIMAFSSVNHMSWMIMCSKFNNETWMKYLIIYSMMIIIMTKFFEKNSINFLNQMTMNTKNNMEKMNIIIMFMSLGGLPPFLGFLPKWMAIQSLMNTNSNTILMIMLMSSMITLFYYMRIISPMIMINSTMNKWNFKYKNSSKNEMIMMIMNLSLPVTSMINMN